MEFSNYENRFEIFKKYFHKITLQITGDYGEQEEYEEQEEDYEKSVHRNSKDLKHDKFKNQANSFENIDFLKDFHKKSNKKVKNLIKIGVTRDKKILKRLNNADKPKRKTKKEKEADLKLSRKLSIVSPNEISNSEYWLNDLNIDLVLDEMKKKFKHVNIVTLAQLAWYERKNDYTYDFEKTENLIVIVNVNKDHWVTLTNIDCQIGISQSQTYINKPVFMYDSLNSNKYITGLETLLGCMFTQRDKFHVHKVHSFFPQISGNDCGLFALAFARMLCEFNEPSLVEFNQYTMRKCYNDCVDNNMCDFNIDIISNNALTHVRSMQLYELTLKKY